MKFKTDENLPIQAAELLRDAGYDALTVLEQGMGGEADNNIRRIRVRE
jgi:predicted nuclease of predicted toxin-antitoxin system